MADISPVENKAFAARVVSWTDLSTADTGIGYGVPKQAGLAGSVQVTGTFGSATITLQGSNDNTNWADLNDVDGTAISLTAAGMAEFSTAALYIRPNSTGGTADDVTVTVALHG